MPSFFDFNEGTETGARLSQDSTPLLGRFRAVPHTHSLRQKQSVGDLFSSFTGGSGGSFGYGGLWRTRSNTSAPETEGDDWDTDAEGIHGVGKVVRAIKEVWIKPERHAVGWVLDRWWLRWLVMVGLPAMIVVVWCALPFPQYPIPDDFDDDPNDTDGGGHHHIPGHGEARVQVNFWFFLFVFYSQYVVTALIWITKVFNIYSLNWWPQTLGFPLTVSMIATIAIAAPIPLYYIEETREYLQYNTIWIFWTFLVMALPVAIAFLILLLSERHLSLRQSLSDTQRIFTQSWWTGEDGMEDTIARRNRRQHPNLSGSFDPCDSDNLSLGGHSDFRIPLPARPRAGPKTRAREALGLNRIWIPASFMRFIWFCAALLIGLSAYVLGETYAEIYLRTLPHNNIETIFYVYSWVITIHLLDGLTAWILGGNEGERVGSYPLGWIFKLYFSLTYQTYVRALYARLRSPQQFMLLQLISSSTLIILHPLTMSSWWHWILNIFGLNNQKYEAYAKFCRRSIFIRTLSENVSMAAFLGQIVVLHYGSNRDVYPYFAFDGDADGGSPIVWDPRPSYPPAGGDGSPGWSSGGSGEVEKLYDFHRTLQLSAVTWACEILAAWVVRRVVRVCYKKDVAAEGWGDLRRWPELLPTSAAVMVHVLQNMVFGIIRIRFREPGAA